MSVKLAEKNIIFVRENTMDGMTYGWFVRMKGESRSYINYENGKRLPRTTVKEYPAERLPKTIQRFIEKRHRQEVEMPDVVFGKKVDNDGFAQYIYK